MKVLLGRTFRPVPYENIKFEIEVCEKDLPIVKGELADDKHRRFHRYAYRKMLLFAIFHKIMTVDEAKLEMERYDKFYGTGK